MATSFNFENWLKLTGKAYLPGQLDQAFALYSEEYSNWCAERGLSVDFSLLPEGNNGGNDKMSNQEAVNNVFNGSNNLKNVGNTIQQQSAALSKIDPFAGKLASAAGTGFDIAGSIKNAKANWGQMSNTAKTASGAGIAGAAADAARGLLFSGLAANDSALTSGINLAYDAVSSGLMAFAPVGTIVGGAMKVGAFVGDAMQAIGGGTDQMTTTDQLMDSSFFSWNVGLINGFGGKKTQEFAANKNTLEQVGSAYGGTSDDIMEAAKHANKKYGLFSSGERKKWDRNINIARTRQNLMTNIADFSRDQSEIASNMSDINHLNYNYNMSGGYDQRYMRAARIGGRIELSWLPQMELSWQPEVLLEWAPSFKQGGEINIEIELDWTPQTDVVELEWTPSFKEGGKVETEEKTEEEKELQVDTNQMNVIPEGALHKNKHHIENTEDYTQKGIPVVDIDGEQQAEIECNEIIFTLEVTKKLEDWYKEFYNEETSNARKDEVAILAGKLLVEQILYNTDDRTGLIDTLKKGGNIPMVNKEFKQNNNVTQELINEMVKLALLNILMK